MSASGTKVHPKIRKLLKEIVKLGGDWKMSSDGHALIYDQENRLVGKLRTSGNGSAQDKRLIEGIMRRMREARDA